MSFVLFGKGMRLARWAHGWKSSYLASDLADDVSLGVLFLRDTNGFIVCKSVLTLVTLPLAWGLPGKVLGISVCLLFVLDALASLLNRAPAGLERAHDNSGCPVIPPVHANG